VSSPLTAFAFDERQDTTTNNFHLQTLSMAFSFGINTFEINRKSNDSASATLRPSFFSLLLSLLYLVDWVVDGNMRSENLIYLAQISLMFLKSRCETYEEKKINIFHLLWQTMTAYLLAAIQD
jgi:hypothetical protein